MITKELADLWEAEAKKEEAKWDKNNEKRYRQAADCLDGYSFVAESIKHDRREHMKNFTKNWWKDAGYIASFDQFNNLTVV